MSMQAALTLPASVTIETTAALAAALPAQVRGGSGMLRIDAGAVTESDSSTIALLLEAGRQARAAGREFEVVGAPPKLVDLARLYGVDSLLALVSAPDAAASAAGSVPASS